MSTRSMAQSVCPGEMAIYGQCHKAVRSKGNQNRPLLLKKQSAEGKKKDVRKSCFGTGLLTNSGKASIN